MLLYDNIEICVSDCSWSQYTTIPFAKQRRMHAVQFLTVFPVAYEYSAILKWKEANEEEFNSSKLIVWDFLFK